MATADLHLLIIDPQNDFCDLPACTLPPGQTPALAVPGAHGDMLRLAEFVAKAGHAMSAITVTLDCHQNLDIAHPGFWQHGDGKPLAPFTQVSAQQVRSGEILPRTTGARDRALRYLESLESAGRYRHMVWPVHCQAGTWGHAVHAGLLAACNAWEGASLRNIAWVYKGMNPWTEHFSAVMAEVPDTSDASTGLNQSLLYSLQKSERILIAGEAGSHCVKATTEHIVEHIGAEHLSRITLLEDAMSPVQGFEAQQTAFLEAMQSKGLQVRRIPELLREMEIN